MEEQAVIQSLAVEVNQASLRSSVTVAIRRKCNGEYTVSIWLQRPGRIRVESAGSLAIIILKFSFCECHPRHSSIFIDAYTFRPDGFDSDHGDLRRNEWV